MEGEGEASVEKEAQALTPAMAVGWERRRRQGRSKSNAAMVSVVVVGVVTSLISRSMQRCEHSGRFGVSGYSLSSSCQPSRLGRTPRISREVFLSVGCTRGSTSSGGMARNPAQPTPSLFRAASDEDVSAEKFVVDRTFLGDVSHANGDAVRVNGDAQQQLKALEMLSEVDVRYDRRRKLSYEPSLERFVYEEEHDDAEAEGPAASEKAARGRLWIPTRLARSVMRNSISPLLKAAFIPEGVTAEYYRYVKWRVLQRYVNAIVHVLGTQSLLLGLGLRNRSAALGWSAALNWVLKDALGKLVRMIWASRMGRNFDSDAKRWRYRSSLIFALGNGLEIVTYMSPSLFLLFATLSNCCKQVSMLTSSATRNALYNSFRDGKRENIGDITAKGEAQIAVVDLLGIASGVILSRFIGLTVKSVLLVWMALQVVENFCMYKQLRAVIFRVLNFERLYIGLEQFLDGVESAEASKLDTKQAAARFLFTPKQMAVTEKLFLPPAHLARRAICFGSIGRARLSPAEITELMAIFSQEKFFLVVGEDVKNQRFSKKSPLDRCLNLTTKQRRSDLSTVQENCHIVLHADANNADIVKATLALSVLRRKLAKRWEAQPDVISTQIRSSDCMDLIRQTQRETDSLFPKFLNALAVKGWAAPARFMFGRVRMRAEWPRALYDSSRKSSSRKEQGGAPETTPTKTSLNTTTAPPSPLQTTPLTNVEQNVGETS